MVVKPQEVIAELYAAGGRIDLPSPGRAANGGTGPAAVYSLGLFSGLASSCCAPVLAGLVALSGISQSLGPAFAFCIQYRPSRRKE